MAKGVLGSLANDNNDPAIFPMRLEGDSGAL